MEEQTVIDDQHADGQPHEETTPHEGAPDEPGAGAGWRHRALAAESRLEQLEEELSGARRAADDAERRRESERLLLEHGALDLETALMLTEAAVGQMDEPDVASAVEELRRRKPFLFSAPSRASAMSESADGGPDPLEGAAAEARATGDRRVLLRYLRMKRGRG